MPEAIFEDGPVDTPYVYTVSGTGTVTPRACAAVFNGSGAGGNFIPAVIFRSLAGNVIARAILDSTITAGDDAEVSWFPGVKHSAAAAVSTGLPFASVQLADPASPLVAGTYAPNIQQLRVNTPGAAIFSVDPLKPTYLQVASPGIYCGELTYAMSNPFTLPVGGFITVQLEGGSVVGSPSSPIFELANTVATKRVQNLFGITYWRDNVAGQTRYILRTNQSMSNVGPLGWCFWQVSPSVET